MFSRNASSRYCWCTPTSKLKFAIPRQQLLYHWITSLIEKSTIIKWYKTPVLLQISVLSLAITWSSLSMYTEKKLSLYRWFSDLLRLCHLSSEFRVSNHVIKMVKVYTDLDAECLLPLSAHASTCDILRSNNILFIKWVAPKVIATLDFGSLRC